MTRLAFFVLTLAHASFAQQDFFETVGIAVGREPRQLMVADMNLDTRPDVVAVTDDGFSLLIATGADFLVADYPIDTQVLKTAAIADLNADGFPDIIIEQDDAIAWLLNLGDGTLGAPQSVPSVPNANGIAIGDLNADGRDDVVVCDTGFPGPSLHVAQTDGSLGPAQIIGTLTGATSLAIAEVTGDDLPDVIVSDKDLNAIVILTNLGNETFDQGPPVSPGDDPGGPIAADLDLDGDLDLIARDVQDGMYVLHNDGTGAFTPVDTFDPDDLLRHLRVADVSADDRDDIIFIQEQSDTLQVLLNDGEGTYLPPQTYHLDESPSDLLLSDLDADGLDDVVVTHFFRDKLSILINVGDGTFSPPSLMSTIKDPYDLAAADFDLDGNIDLFVASLALDILFAHHNHGDATFTSSFYEMTVQHRRRLAADLNADGLEDLIVTHEFKPDGNVTIYLSDGDILHEHDTLFAGAGPIGAVAEDLDADGDLDLAFASYGTEDAVILRNNGDATFQPPLQIPVTGEPEFIAAGDIDADGDLDLVLATEIAPYLLHVLLNKGDATFHPPATVHIDGYIRALAVARIDDDPYADIVIAHSSTMINVYRGDPDGSLALASTTNIGGDFLTALDVADINGDARPDIAAGIYDGDIVLLYGLGDATFQPGPVIAHPAAPTDLYLVDLDGAGDLDLVTAAFELNADSQLLVYQSTQPGTYAVAQQSVLPGISMTLGTLDARPGPDMITGASFGFYYIKGIPLTCAADTNADGKLDILDFITFQLLWQAADPAADCDADADFTILDFLCFQQRFVEGCP